MITDQIFNFLFGQYSQYSFYEITLELFAMIFGVVSVVFARANNVLVYPTGIISTGIYVYLLFNWGLIGDLIINIYFFLMSIYGWFFWQQKKLNKHINIISSSDNSTINIVVVIFLISFISVFLIYKFFNMWNNSFSMFDTLTTSIFFSAMFLMAKRKIEHWSFWIIGNFISIPLYFYKGATITSIQYIIFIFLAISGFFKWKKILNKTNQNVLK